MPREKLDFKVVKRITSGAVLEDLESFQRVSVEAKTCTVQYFTHITVRTDGKSPHRFKEQLFK